MPVFDIMEYGAVGNGIADDTQAFIDMFDDMPLVGGRAYIPTGMYKTTETIDIPANTILEGDGQTASQIHAYHTGSCLRTLSPVNSSVAMNVRIRSLGLHAGVLGSNGAGFEDNCGTYISLYDVFIYRFKWGIIFDQTEVSYVDLCNIAGQEAGGSCIWLTNGDTRRANAAGGFTNCLHFSRCQLNSFPDAYIIIDEGGVTHSFINNNYNAGGPNSFYFAGVAGGLVVCGEFEGNSSGYTGELNTFSFYPSLSTGERIGVGSCSGVNLLANQIGHTEHAAIKCTSVGNLILLGNNFSGAMPMVDHLTDTANFTGIGNGYGTQYPPSMFKPGYISLSPVADSVAPPDSFFIGSQHDNASCTKNSEGVVTALGIEGTIPGPQGPAGPTGSQGIQGPPAPSRIYNVASFTITEGQSAIIVPHGLGGQPRFEDVAIFPEVAILPDGTESIVWISSVTESSVVVRLNGTAPSSGRTFTISANRLA